MTLKLIAFMSIKKNKVAIAKDPECEIIRSLTIKMLIWRLMSSDSGRKVIDSTDGSEGSLILKLFRIRCRAEHKVSNVENMMMLSFGPIILCRGA